MGLFKFESCHFYTGPHLTLFVYKAHSSRTSCSYVPVTLSKTREAAENKLPNAQGRQHWRPASSRRECQQDTLALQSVSRPCPAHTPPSPAETRVPGREEGCEHLGPSRGLDRRGHEASWCGRDPLELRIWAPTQL